MLDFNLIMTNLAAQRPIFHSEADFQHALAWELHEQHPRARIRLEYRPLRDRNMYTDIWVSDGSETCAIELKYLTRACSVVAQGENFDLRSGADDIDRYDFVKDVVRLETVHAAVGARGLALLLSNNSAHWLPPRAETVIDRDFRVHEGRVLSGTLAWDPQTSVSTTEGRENALVLMGQYPLTWQDYSHVSDKPFASLRYLCVDVK